MEQQKKIVNVFIAIGILLLIFAVGHPLVQKIRFRDFLSTKGKIIGSSYLSYGTLRSAENVPHPNFEFTTQSGQIVKATAHLGVRGYHKPGETINVIYNPNNLKEAYIDNFIDLWAGSLVATFIGTIFVVVGVGNYPHKSRKRKN